MAPNLINALFLQTLWFAAVFGAAAGLLWPALLLLGCFGLWSLRPMIRIQGDGGLVLVAVLIGFMLDSAWVKLGWLSFAGSWPRQDLAPLWIVILWAGLALTLNHSLAWLQSNLLLAALLAGLSSPFSYLAAERFGALQIIGASGEWAFGLGLSWAVVLPFMLWLAKQLKQLPLRGKEHV